MNTGVSQCSHVCCLYTASKVCVYQCTRTSTLSDRHKAAKLCHLKLVRNGYSIVAAGLDFCACAVGDGLLGDWGRLAVS